MAKAKQAFSGRDTLGRWVEMAQREDGQWFARWQEERGRFGWAMSKWAAHDAPEPLTRERSAYSDGFVTLPEGQFVAWGFRKLERLDGPFTYRLPNN